MVLFYSLIDDCGKQSYFLLDAFCFFFVIIIIIVVGIVKYIP